MSDCSVHIFGNIGKMEASYTPKGKFVLKGSVAVNHGKKPNQFTNWFNFVVWEDLGERMNQYCQSGSFVYIEGSLLLREWTDKDGVKHTSPDVTVSSFRLLGRGKEKKEVSEDEPEYMQD